MKIELSELRKVKGIGPKTIERIKEQLDVDAPSVYNKKNHLTKNEVHLGDVLDLIQGMPNESVDLLITDPPYKVVQGGATNNAFTLAGGSDYSKGTLFKNNSIEFEDWASEVYRVQKEGTHAYVFTNDRNMQNLLNSFTNAGYRVLNILAWNKNTHSPNRYYLKNVEFIVMFRKGIAKNINKMGSFTSLRFDAVKEKSHPSQKPVVLFEHLIKNSTGPNEVVFDPFMGSGTTAVASINTNRNFIGTEKDEEYFIIANNRIKELEE